MSRKVLVVAPHADDETFGVGGTILKRIAAGDDVHIVVMCAGPVKYHHSGALSTRASRVLEFNAVVESFGESCSGEVLAFEQDSLMDTVPLRDVIGAIEAVQDKFVADVWYVPGPSTNQDHQVCYEACMAAARPTRRNLPSEIYKYELPTYCWSPREWQMQVHVYEDVTPFIDKKVEILKCYESQMRGGSNMLSLDNTKKWAEIRGFDAGVGAAECFEVIRMIRR